MSFFRAMFVAPPLSPGMLEAETNIIKENLSNCATFLETQGSFPEPHPSYQLQFQGHSNSA